MFKISGETLVAREGAKVKKISIIKMITIPILVRATAPKETEVIVQQEAHIFLPAHLHRAEKVFSVLVLAIIQLENKVCLLVTKLLS